MPAPLELGPMRVGRRRDQPADRLVRAEDREALRYARRRSPVRGVRLLVEGVRGGGAGAGEPVQADRGEQLVTVDRQVGPFLELLRDPGELQQRRVDQAVADGLRPAVL